MHTVVASYSVFVGLHERTEIRQMNAFERVCVCTPPTRDRARPSQPKWNYTDFYED